MLETINAELVTIALERAEGDPFERFVNAFYPAVSGSEFVPLGGNKDGGADGFIEIGLTESRARVGTFLQASVQEDHRAKVRATIARLVEFGRKPTSLVYVTSRFIQHIDKEEDFLSDELRVNIRIKDRRYIAAHITTSHVTIAAFDDHLRRYLDFLSTPGNVPLIAATEQVQSPAVYVFLRQEVERRSGKSTLLDAVTDGLILWALEGTDPDRDILMSREEILDKIEATVPPAKQFIRKTFKARIEYISSKFNTTGRAVRWYRKSDRFCLPYETRLLVEEENASDEALRVRVKEILTSRALEDSKSAKQLGMHEANSVADVAMLSLQLTFQSKGLEFSSFLADSEDDDDSYSVSDSIDRAMQQFQLSGEDQVSLKPVVSRVLRYTLYESSPEERQYLSRMSRTYLLLFSLNAEPRIVDYFQKMASDFYLYVGSDLLVHALSERFLRSEDQMTTNLLGMMARAGAHLVLTEPVLDEVHRNIETSDWEYQNFLREVDAHVTVHIARHSPKILIRSYFYAKLDPPDGVKGPTNWPNFINNFCSFEQLHSPAGKDELKSYLVNKFRLRYESRAALQKLCDSRELANLTARLEPYKKKLILAENDALMVLATYGRREDLKEHSKSTSFGYRTWWLTHEVNVRKHTTELLRKNRTQYIMRPEFLLNFIALSPSTVDVRKTYENVFPTLLNVRLSGRMQENAFMA